MKFHRSCGSGVVSVAGADITWSKPQTWRHLEAQLRRSNPRVFVISEEALLGRTLTAPPVMLARLAESCGMDVQVVAYVRPQCQYFESRYVQWVKSAVMRLPFDAFVAASFALRPIERHPWLNYNRVFERWRAVFGDRLAVVPLDRSHMPEGLTAHFLDLLGVADLNPEQAKRANVRLGAKALEAYRLASAACWRRYRRPFKNRKAFSRALPAALAPERGFAGFTADAALDLMRQFEAENAVFARNYGIDSGGLLFREPVVDDRRRVNVACWDDFNERERAAVCELAAQALGVDVAPRTRRSATSRAERASRRGIGSARWHAKWLLEPRLPYWILHLHWRLKRRRILRRRFQRPRPELRVR